MRGKQPGCDHPGRVVRRWGSKQRSVCNICRTARRRARRAEIKAGINVITPVTAEAFLALASRPWRRA